MMGLDGKMVERLGKSAEANYSTLATPSGYIEVAHSPADVCNDIEVSIEVGSAVVFRRMIRTQSRADAAYRGAVVLDPRHITAVFPLDEIPYEDHRT